LRPGLLRCAFRPPEHAAATNFIATVWDLCHRDTPEFPEVRESAEFQVREHFYRTILPSAFVVLTDSTALAAAIVRRYGIDPERLLPMPFAPAPFLAPGASAEKLGVLEKYGLNEGYFLYPAQFWAHKNHIRILQALLLLKSDGYQLRVAFAGGDKGGRAYIEGFAETSALRDQVRFLGFVPSEDMRGLYEGCCAVVLPTYFGPTNIPRLEAWLIGRPLIYSSRFREQAGDAALYVDPDDANALAQAMRACTDPATSARLVAAGTLRLRQVEQQRKEAESALLARLRQFEARRACWP
jgi:glycosyltransferase involved in cell wall biosynthesis